MSFQTSRTEFSECERMAADVARFELMRRYTVDADDVNTRLPELEAEVKFTWAWVGSAAVAG